MIYSSMQTDEARIDYSTRNYAVFLLVIMQYSHLVCTLAVTMWWPNSKTKSSNHSIYPQIEPFMRLSFGYRAVCLQIKPQPFFYMFLICMLFLDMSQTSKVDSFCGYYYFNFFFFFLHIFSCFWLLWDSKIFATVFPNPSAWLVTLSTLYIP